MQDDDWRYFQSREFRQLLQRYESAQKAGVPLYMDADELTDVAEYYMSQQREKEATAAIALAVDLHPDSIDPQIFLARQQMFHGNLAEANHICDEISDQSDREVYFLRAELLIRAQKTDEADRLLDEALQSMTDEPELFIYDSAGVFMDYALWPQARKWVEKLKQRFPDYPDARFLEADLLVSTGDNEQAEPILNAILDADPYDTRAWNLLADAQSALEKYQEAVDSAEYVLAIEENDRHALLTKANAFFHLNRLEEAHDIYAAVLETDKSDETIYYMDAVCLTNMERFEEAAELLRRANKVGDGFSPEQVHIYLQQAYVESKLHHMRDAIAALDAAKDLASDEVNFEYELLLGQIYLENGFYAEAEEYFKQAIDVSPDKKNTLVLIGISFGECLYYKESAEILEATARIFGEEAQKAALPYLALCYYNLHNDKNYLKYLKKAAEVNRETTEYLFGSYFPGVRPEEYYTYAFKAIHGHFPKQKG